MIAVLLTFMATTALHFVLLILAVRRVARHLQGNDAATKAVTEHVLLPLLGRQEETDDSDASDDASTGGEE